MELYYLLVLLLAVVGLVFSLHIDTNDNDVSTLAFLYSSQPVSSISIIDAQPSTILMLSTKTSPSSPISGPLPARSRNTLIGFTSDDHHVSWTETTNDFLGCVNDKIGAWPVNNLRLIVSHNASDDRVLIAMNDAIYSYSRPSSIANTSQDAMLPCSEQRVFGSSKLNQNSIRVSSFGNILAVGVPNYLNNNKVMRSPSPSGRVYLYHLAEDNRNYQQLEELFPSKNANKTGLFGSNVAIYDKNLAVASLCAGSVGSCTGSVAVYDINVTGFSRLNSILQPSDLALDAMFGHNMVFSSGRGLIAAYEFGVGSFRAQTVVYLFGRLGSFPENNHKSVDSQNNDDDHGSRMKNNMWILVAKLRSPTTDTSPLFGVSLLLYHDHVAVIGDPSAEAGLGITYIYRSYDRKSTGRCDRNGNSSQGVETIVLVSDNPNIIDSSDVETCSGESWQLLDVLGSRQKHVVGYGKGLDEVGGSLVVVADEIKKNGARGGTMVFVEHSQMSQYDIGLGTEPIPTLSDDNNGVRVVLSTHSFSKSTIVISVAAAGGLLLAGMALYIAGFGFSTRKPFLKAEKKLNERGFESFDAAGGPIGATNSGGPCTEIQLGSIVLADTSQGYVAECESDSALTSRSDRATSGQWGGGKQSMRMEKIGSTKQKHSPTYNHSPLATSDEGGVQMITRVSTADIHANGAHQSRGYLPQSVSRLSGVFSNFIWPRGESLRQEHNEEGAVNTLHESATNDLELGPAISGGKFSRSRSYSLGGSHHSVRSVGADSPAVTTNGVLSHKRMSSLSSANGIGNGRGRPDHSPAMLLGPMGQPNSNSVMI